LVTFGPLFDETSDQHQHRERRDKTAALERDLCDAMRAAGYRVLNRVHCLKESDPYEKARILTAFAERFSALQNQAQALASFFASAGLEAIEVERVDAVPRDEGKV
jgi:hypothetical protein